MNKPIKLFFSIGIAVILMLAIEYISLEASGWTPILIIGFVLAVIIYNAISNVESEGEGTWI